MSNGHESPMPETEARKKPLSAAVRVFRRRFACDLLFFIYAQVAYKIVCAGPTVFFPAPHFRSVADFTIKRK